MGKAFAGVFVRSEGVGDLVRCLASIPSSTRLFGTASFEQTSQGQTCPKGVGKVLSEDLLLPGKQADVVVVVGGRSLFP